MNQTLGTTRYNIQTHAQNVTGLYIKLFRKTYIHQPVRNIDVKKASTLYQTDKSWQ